MSKGTVHARIQLKNDTESNWNKSSFVPLPGEVIIYNEDGTHPFFRIKIGNGVLTVPELPFIDAATISGVSINNITAARLNHTLTFGAGQAFTFDGSQDVTVPVYLGNII